MFYWANKLMYRRFELLDLGPPLGGMTYYWEPPTGDSVERGGGGGDMDLTERLPLFQNEDGREALMQIIIKFGATHVFERRATRGFGNDPKKISEIWQRVFQRKYSDCVGSMSELKNAKQANHPLYETSMHWWRVEEKLLQEEFDEKYPPKIFISAPSYPSHRDLLRLLWRTGNFQSTTAAEGGLGSLSALIDGEVLYRGEPYRHTNEDMREAIVTLATTLFNQMG